MPCRSFRNASTGREATTDASRGGGIGRHAVLRGQWAKARRSSNLLLGTTLRTSGQYNQGAGATQDNRRQANGDVAKRFKAGDCKSPIRGFESRRRLQSIPSARTRAHGRRTGAGSPGHIAPSAGTRAQGRLLSGSDPCVYSWLSSSTSLTFRKPCAFTKRLRTRSATSR